MRLRSGGFGAAFADDRQAVAFDNQRVAGAAVAFAEHAGIDLDDVTVEAFEDAPSLRGRMSDYHALRADRIQRCLQPILFDQAATSHVAAVPEWAVRRVQIGLVELACFGDDAHQRCFGIDRRHELLQDARMLVEVVHGGKRTGLVQRLEILDIALQFVGQHAVDALETDVGNHRRQTTVNESGTVDDDDDGL